MIVLMSSIALAELCPSSDAAEFVSWARPALFEWGEWSHQDGTLPVNTPEAKADGASGFHNSSPQQMLFIAFGSIRAHRPT